MVINSRTKLNDMKRLTEEEFSAAISAAKTRCASKGDAQAHLAEIERSFVNDNDEVVLVYKPISGWRFPEVVLATVPMSLLQ